MDCWPSTTARITCAVPEPRCWLSPAPSQVLLGYACVHLCSHAPPPLRPLLLCTGAAELRVRPPPWPPPIPGCSPTPRRLYACSYLAQVPLSYAYAHLIPENKRYSLRDAIQMLGQRGMRVRMRQEGEGERQQAGYGSGSEIERQAAVGVGRWGSEGGGGAADGVGQWKGRGSEAGGRGSIPGRAVEREGRGGAVAAQAVTDSCGAACTAGRTVGG